MNSNSDRKLKIDIPTTCSHALQVRRSGWSAPKDSGVWQVAYKLRTRLMSGLPEDVANLLKDELAYFDDITEVSGKLYPVHKVRIVVCGVE